MKALDEWNEMISKIRGIYIFGAGKVAVKLAELVIHSKKRDQLLGFIVSEKAQNPSSIMGVPVFQMSDDVDKSATVLVSLSEVYHPEIRDKISDAGFNSIVMAHQFYSIDYSKKDKVEHYIEDVIDNAIEIPDYLRNYRLEMINKYFESSHSFGGGGFYQSSPLLGIRGTRNTEKRIREYGLLGFLSTDSEVLDIGSNVGFLDLEIASNVKSITGLEYSDSLVEIGNDTVKALGMKNVNFIRADYKEWQKSNTHQYDVVMSFAVHGWLEVKPEEYAIQLYKMLKKQGILLFESQQLSTDKLFEAFLEVMQQCFVTIKKGLLKDDGVTDRMFAVLKKEQ